MTHAASSVRASSVGAERPRARYGLSYLNNRYYDPQAGVFTSVDPLVATTGDPYLYANGNPTTLSDPSGLCSVRYDRSVCADQYRARPKGPVSQSLLNPKRDVCALCSDPGAVSAARAADLAAGGFANIASGGRGSPVIRYSNAAIEVTMGNDQFAELLTAVGAGDNVADRLLPTAGLTYVIDGGWFSDHPVHWGSEFVVG